MKKKLLCIFLTGILCLVCMTGVYAAPISAGAADGNTDEDEPDTAVPQGISVTLQGPGTLYMLADGQETWEPVDILIPYGEEAGWTLKLRAVSEVADSCGVFVDEAAIAAAEEDTDGISAWTFTVEDPYMVRDLFIVFGEQTAGLSPVWVALGTGSGTLEVQTGDGGWELSTDAVYYRKEGDMVVVRAIPREEGTIAARYKDNGKIFSPTLFGAGYTQYTILVEADGNGVVVDFTPESLVRAVYNSIDGALFAYLGNTLCAVLNGGTFPTSENDLTQCVVYAYDAGQKTLNSVRLDKETLAWQPVLGGEILNRWEFFLAPEAQGLLELEFSAPGTVPDIPDEPGPPDIPDTPDIPDIPDEPNPPDISDDPGTNPDQILIGEGIPVGLRIIISADGTSQVLSGLTAGAADGMTAGILKSYLIAPKDAVLEILSADEAVVEDTETVATGMRIRAVGPEGSNYEQEIGIVVTGDVLGTGILNISQVVRVAQSLNGSAPLSGLYLMAADFNSDGGISITDLVSEAKLLIA